MTRTSYWDGSCTMFQAHGVQVALLELDVGVPLGHQTAAVEEGAVRQAPGGGGGRRGGGVRVRRCSGFMGGRETEIGDINTEQEINGQRETRYCALGQHDRSSQDRHDALNQVDESGDVGVNIKINAKNAERQKRRLGQFRRARASGANPKQNYLHNPISKKHDMTPSSPLLPTTIRNHVPLT